MAMDIRIIEGMCCMNLSYDYQSIHASIQKSEENVKKLQWDDRTDWLGQLLQYLNIYGWAERLLRLGIYVLGIVLCLFMIVPCLLQCMQRMVNNAVQCVLYVEEKGGSVAEQNELNDMNSTADLMKLVQQES